MNTKFQYKSSVSKRFTRKFLDNNLFSSSGVFNDWWHFPETYISSLASCCAYIDNEYVGIAVINIAPKECYLRCNTKKSDLDLYYPSWKIVGISGFYVKLEYRNLGIASKLAKNLERHFTKTLSEKDTPLVICTGRAYDIGKYNWKKLVPVRGRYEIFDINQ